MSSRNLVIAIITLVTGLSLAPSAPAEELPPYYEQQPPSYDQPPPPYYDQHPPVPVPIQPPVLAPDQPPALFPPPQVNRPEEPKREKCRCKEVTAKLKYANAHSYNSNGTETWWLKGFGDIDCEGDGPEGSCRGKVRISGRGVVGGPHDVKCQGKPVCKDNGWGKEFKLRLTRPIGSRIVKITVKHGCEEQAKPSISVFNLVFVRGRLDRKRSDLP